MSLPKSGELQFYLSQLLYHHHKISSIGLELRAVQEKLADQFGLTMQERSQGKHQLSDWDYSISQAKRSLKDHGIVSDKDGRWSITERGIEKFEALYPVK